VIALAGISILLVRRFGARARDEAEAKIARQ